jgi:hypothetical protein
MNFLKKGPELKLSELKVPDFVYDLFYDLKERHLLPLVAILIVAMVGLPIYLKSKDSGGEPVTAPTIATASTANGGEEALVVAHSTPGLRSPKTRLNHDRAVDPFSEKGGSPSTEASETSSEEPSTPAESTPSETPVEATVIGGETSSPSEVVGPVEQPSESGVTVESPHEGGSDEGSGPTRTRYASDAIDVRIVALPSSSGDAKKKQKPEAEIRRDLPELTMLPARSTPAVTFMGASRDGKKALMVVSSDVVSIFGEATCVIGSQSCQLLALEPGLPETFVYGPQERRFRIEVLKIEKTLSAKPRRAALGTTKKGNGGDGGKQESGGEPAVEAPAERGGEESAAG